MHTRKQNTVITVTVISLLQVFPIPSRFSKFCLVIIFTDILQHQIKSEFESRVFIAFLIEMEQFKLFLKHVI